MEIFHRQLEEMSELETQISKCCSFAPQRPAFALSFPLGAVAQCQALLFFLDCLSPVSSLLLGHSLLPLFLGNPSSFGEAIASTTMCPGFSVRVEVK